MEKDTTTEKKENASAYTLWRKQLHPMEKAATPYGESGYALWSVCVSSIGCFRGGQTCCRQPTF